MSTEHTAYNLSVIETNILHLSRGSEHNICPRKVDIITRHRIFYVFPCCPKKFSGLSEVVFLTKSYIVTASGYKSCNDNCKQKRSPYSCALYTKIFLRLVSLLQVVWPCHKEKNKEAHVCMVSKPIFSFKIYYFVCCVNI